MCSAMQNQNRMWRLKHCLNTSATQSKLPQVKSGCCALDSCRPEAMSCRPQAMSCRHHACASTYPDACLMLYSDHPWQFSTAAALHRYRYAYRPKSNNHQNSSQGSLQGSHPFDPYYGHFNMTLGQKTFALAPQTYGSNTKVFTKQQQSSSATGYSRKDNSGTCNTS